MELNHSNYFSGEANKEYVSASQFKDFVGATGLKGCEPRALAKIRGEWGEKSTTALKVGSYVDAHFSGTLDIFKAKNPEIFRKDGGLKAEYERANTCINRMERDPLFMNFMSGEKQVIMTEEMFGAKWKICIDSYLEGKCIVDLKTMASIRDPKYVAGLGHTDFIRYYGYDIQGAVYQKIVEIKTGQKLPFVIAAVTKEEYPDIELIYVDQSWLDEALNVVEKNIDQVIALKNGTLKPIGCGACDYCRHTKVLKEFINASELLGDV